MGPADCEAYAAWDFMDMSNSLDRQRYSPHVARLQSLQSNARLLIFFLVCVLIFYGLHDLQDGGFKVWVCCKYNIIFRISLLIQ